LPDYFTKDEHHDMLTPWRHKGETIN